jgi:hypothetical protein
MLEERLGDSDAGIVAEQAAAATVPRSRSRMASATVAPASLSTRAECPPSAPDAPVTRATRPVSENSGARLFTIPPLTKKRSNVRYIEHDKLGNQRLFLADDASAGVEWVR